ncbi:precorrin-3B synthase [Micromonospora sagamiensis]|uniref:Precorrin-3B synthase n=1 Tax=Micromonospora sagamiensis TaxID=47875 RepID=A0A562WIZ8_9ACTN|nr:precorrin-3B synthase [Micromonospora sagamiensis]TWJ29514.1 precorrin-3B synthase [Micromonospora sagamiensis]BCL17458.1 precorrin-3B synthase [Micromonospora sagamiensis]
MPDVSSPSRRPADDRCPGALRAHQAADGALVRVRIPGGRLDPAQVRCLATAARRDGDGTLELTSRGNVQVRGITDPAGVDRIASALVGVGLLPSATHERVRNIVASPLSGLDATGRVDVRPLVGAVDAALCAAGDLAGLSGRFLIALDDGRGDLTGLGADLCWTAGTGALLVSGTDVGIRVTTDVPAAIVTAARVFLRLCAGRTGLWRIADLPDAPAAIAAALDGPQATPVEPPRGLPPTVGVHPAGFTVVAAPLGRLTADQADTLAAVASTLVVTPWRTVVVTSAEPTAVSTLATAGLVVDPASPWVGVTSCTGRPGCEKSLADVRADATAALAAAGPRTPEALPLHWAGCDRCCGRPAGPAALAVATGSGYRVAGPAGEHHGPIGVRLAQARGAQ